MDKKRFLKTISGSSYVSALLILIILLAINSAHAQSTFEIFTTQDNAQPGPGITIYNVEQGDNLLKSINRQMGLDGVMDDKTAATYVTQQLQDVLIAQMTGLTKAAQYRLKYFPAIVKDGKFVIYGTTNPKVFNGIRH